MLPHIKPLCFTIISACVISIATITSPFTSVFGKHYYSKKDFVCCTKNQLVVHHYYTLKLLWVTVADGYTVEKTGKESKSGCDILCTE